MLQFPWLQYLFFSSNTLINILQFFVLLSSKTVPANLTLPSCLALLDRITCWSYQVRIRPLPQIFEINLKQDLWNSGQGDGHWPGPYPKFPENDCRWHYSGACNGKTLKAMYFLPSSNGAQAHILTYSLPVCDQVHPVQLAQPFLFTEMKIQGLVSYLNNSPSIPGSICPWVREVYRLEAFFYRSLFFKI